MSHQICHIEGQASRMDKYDADLSSCMLEFGLGCDALAHVDDEIDGVSSPGTSAAGAGVAGKDEGDSPPHRTSRMGGSFRLFGKTADRTLAVLSSNNDGRDRRVEEEGGGDRNESLP